MGPGSLDRLIASRGESDFWKLARSGKLNGQTRAFVPKFIAAALIVRNMERHTLTEMAANMDLIAVPEARLAEAESAALPGVS
jgi:hypothetical protein